MARTSARNVNPGLSSDPRDKPVAALNWFYGKLKRNEPYDRAPMYFDACLEWHVTQAAISHQIKTLEDHLGVPLFQRRNKAVLLTEAGQLCLPGVRDGFARLAEAVDGLRALQTDSVLSVTTSPSFAAKWLVPRLERFRAANPELDVRIDASTQLVDFARENIDVGIRYGAGSYAGLTSESLFGTEVFPVCSPRLRKGPQALRTPADLKRHTLLHTEWFARTDEPDWRMPPAGIVGSAPLLSVADLKVHFRIGGGLLSRRPAAILKAVDGVNFELRPGETLGLVGESGCGKSTLGRAVLRLLPNATGRIVWLGQDLAQLSHEAMRRKRQEMQIVFQDPLAALNPRMPVGEIIAEPLKTFQPNLSTVETKARVKEMMAKVGLLPNQINRYPHEFSGGQCQRIGIARAMRSRQR